MKPLIECGTCGYPLTAEEREGLVEIDGKMCKHSGPVAWMVKLHDGNQFVYDKRMLEHIDSDIHATRQPLYTAPPQRKPIDDKTLWEMWVESPSDVLRFARAIERAHGIGGEE